jgi:hypothetical protein
MPPTRKIPSRLETDPKKMLKRLVGLPEIIVLGLFADDEHVESTTAQVQVFTMT